MNQEIWCESPFSLPLYSKDYALCMKTWSHLNFIASVNPHRGLHSCGDLNIRTSWNKSQWESKIVFLWYFKGRCNLNVKFLNHIIYFIHIHKKKNCALKIKNTSLLTFNISMNNHITVQIMDTLQNLTSVFPSHILSKSSICF